ncbi:ATP-binding protein [Klebsiella pneumoniae]|uniref:AAA family ATPase n=2 Tax=Klebsiella pneumoniae TaxID=573 RepID=UPI000E2D8542|nr:AAA family ATPase [Klebsiella pneumoniae]DAF74374.1 MAG TPA: AAA domain protein [Caudoviricetes sp.]MBL6013613.1 ATP-binding protein [Klebsiella pneumoniae]MCW9199375.1 ATP-binding protein [Klebsiella pneumoniae]MDP0870628.1 AAA family ATPase [Klebsiella pneumoniae]MEC5522611.1 AAA family ATPase [Klebsiella pneumoniae]
MNIIVKSEKPYNGFFLQNELSFDGYSCLLTGKNGCGKTRLLKGIEASCISVFLNGEQLKTNDIRQIQTNTIDSGKFTSNGNSDNSKILADAIFTFTSSNKELIENHPIYFEKNLRNYEAPLANIKKIANNASLLFNKEISELSSEEIHLSILLNKELSNNITGNFSGNNLDSLSQLSIDYLLTSRINRNIAFNKSEGDDVTPLPEDIILKYMGENSPHKIFNEIINKMFRGKFHISPPNERSGHISYNPNLILSSTEESVKIENLSNGEKTIFWLAIKTFEISMSRPDEYLKKSKIILLDEPDSRLHPLMIVDFLNCLKLLHESLNIAFIFTTHSPTTVALMDNENIFNIDINTKDNKNSITKQSKDLAISQLLDGVVQVSVNPDNSRQIYVENKNDSSIYAEIYRIIKRRSKKKIIEIPLNFISSGPKIAITELEKHINSVLKNTDDSLKKTLADTINGSGDCGQVIGTVTHLIDGGNTTVRGIIDWDVQDRTPPPQVKVFAKNYAYSIENVVYDPISLFALIMHLSLKKPSYYFECDEDFIWTDVKSDTSKLQRIVDVITRDLLGRENNKDHVIKYMGGINLQGDRKYFIPRETIDDPALKILGSDVRNGHDLEDVIVKKFIPGINKIHNKTSKQPLIFHFTKKITIDLLGPDFISCAFEDIFSEID